MATPRVLIVLSLIFVLVAGCGSVKPLPLENHFANIAIGQSTATEILTLLDSSGMLSTESSVSVFEQQQYSKELGIVQFNPENSLVLRKDYMQLCNEPALLLFNQERFNLFMQSEVPAEVLNKVYLTESEKQLGVLDYFRETLVSDSRSYLEDQETFGIIGIARSVLQQGALKLMDNPREAPDFYSEKGFVFSHPVYGSTRLRMVSLGDIYTLTATSTDWVDPFMTWWK
ncbi:MAG: hypothetical protein GY869_06545 [Planctomycetes bacterium]|nr:hypothetical protein [Planctomycetota bacterium]